MKRPKFSEIPEVVTETAPHRVVIKLCVPNQKVMDVAASYLEQKDDRTLAWRTVVTLAITSFAKNEYVGNGDDEHCGRALHKVARSAKSLQRSIERTPSNAWQSVRPDIGESWDFQEALKSLIEESNRDAEQLLPRRGRGQPNRAAATECVKRLRTLYTTDVATPGQATYRKPNAPKSPKRFLEAMSAVLATEHNLHLGSLRERSSKKTAK